MTANHLKGVDDYGGSSCATAGKPACSIIPLKYLYTNALSMGDKQEELEVCVCMQGHDLTAITETCGIAHMTGTQSWMAMTF